MVKDLMISMNNKSKDVISNIAHKLKSPLKMFGFKEILDTFNKIKDIDSDSKVNSFYDKDKNIYFNSFFKECIIDLNDKFLKVMEAIKSISNDLLSKAV